VTGSVEEEESQLSTEDESLEGTNEEERKQDTSELEEPKVKEDSTSNNSLSSFNVLQTEASNATEMYEAVINASNASSAWMRAQEFKDTYPNDSRLEEAINVAADRIYSMGKANHKNNEFSVAIHYYERLINENLINEPLKQALNANYSQALNHVVFMTAEKIYDMVIYANTASEAWDAVQAYKEYYSNDVNLQAAVDHAANRIFTQGQINHKNANFSTAIHYYELLLEEPLISANILEQAETYHLQALNNLILQTDKA